MNAGPTARNAPALVLGAGYAGLIVANRVARRSKGTIPIRVIDRHPIHVLRTELYEVERLAEAPDVSKWVIPLAKALSGKRITYQEAVVTRIDLEKSVVETDKGSEPFSSLAICLGSVPAFYGVPGARENCHSVYRLGAAQKFAKALQAVEAESPNLPPGRGPRIVVVGGGSTGTELAAQIATTDWSRLVEHETRPPEVVLVSGSLPFLVGFPEPLILHARRLLRQAGVLLIQGVNAARVEPGKLFLEDGSLLTASLMAWCAGVQAPSEVAQLPVPHGKAGRIKVDPTLEVPGYPGVFAVGDVAEFQDPKTGMIAPAMAQAAMAEARVAADNLVARRTGQPARPFVYKEKGVIIAVGIHRAAGQLQRLTLWGSPASLLKQITEREYAVTARKGGAPPGL